MAALLLFSCDPSGGGGGSGGITGVVSDATDVKVGAFSSDYWFGSNSDPANVVDEEGFDTTGSYSPLYYVLPDGGGNYTIDLPENPPDMGELIAWVDTNADGAFDLGTETGCLPEKYIDGADRVITGFGWIMFGDIYYYLVSYDNGGAQNDGFDIVGTSGFNFNFP